MLEICKWLHPQLDRDPRENIVFVYFDYMETYKKSD